MVLGGGRDLGEALGLGGGDLGLGMGFCLGGRGGGDGGREGGKGGGGGDGERESGRGGGDGEREGLTRFQYSFWFNFCFFSTRFSFFNNSKINLFIDKSFIVWTYMPSTLFKIFVVRIISIS